MNWVYQNRNGWIDYFRFIQFNTIYHGGIWKKSQKHSIEQNLYKILSHTKQYHTVLNGCT